jgi:hypothetical protein
MMARKENSLKIIQGVSTDEMTWVVGHDPGIHSRANTAQLELANRRVLHNHASQPMYRS